MSTATSGTEEAASALDRLGVRPRGGPAEPRPEDRVDRHVGALELAFERVARPRATAHARRLEPGEVGRCLARGRIVQQERGRPDTRAIEVPSGDQSVAPVVPLAAHDHRAPPVRAAGEPEGGVGDLAARGLHQRVGGDPALLRRAIELRRLHGGQDEPHRGAAAGADPNLIRRPPPRTPPRSSSRA